MRRKEPSVGLVLKSNEVFRYTFSLFILIKWLYGAIRELLIEIRNVCIWGKDRNEWRLDRSTHKRIPVHLLEPRVTTYLIRTYGSKTISWILLKQPH